MDCWTRGPPKGKLCDIKLFFIWLMFYVPVNSYSHVRTVSSPSNTFSWASLSKRLTSTSYTYFGLKTLLQQSISEPIFYGDLVYKFKRIVGKPNFSDQFKKIVKRYIRVGYNLDIMRQSACLVLNPITVYSYGFLFNCTTVGRASDSMTALT